MDHSPAFLKIVNETKPKVKEISVHEAARRLQANPHAVLLDVREDHEWKKGHAEQALHLGKGIFERDVERLVPDPGTEILLYCGGGYRSILAAAAAQQMGYTHVLSISGGYKEMCGQSWPMQTES